jgi:hypothetical protein
LKPFVSGILSAVILTVCAQAASASVINFDDAYAIDGTSKPASFYSAEGVAISGTYAGIVGGVGNGDPGNWGLGGTNGSAFLGCNQGSTCNATFSFSTLQDGVSLDMGVRSGATGTFTLSGYLDGTLVESESATVVGSGADGQWSTFTLTDPLDKIVVSETGTFAYGMDNLVFDAASPASTPEPSSLILLGTGLAGMLGAGRLKWFGSRG